jgi:type I restriction enzyme S subunit
MKSTATKPTLTPKLRFPEFREAEGWTLEDGDALFDQINDRSPEPGLPVLAITQEHGAIPRHMIDYHVSVTEKSIESYKVIRIGDFIISLRSFQGGIEYSRYHGICSPAYVILRRRGKGSDEYYRHYLKTDGFIRILTKNLEGLRDGKMVSYTQFSALQLPNPAPAEQQKIAECLSSVDELIAAQVRKLDALKTHKKGLMQQLFPREGETQPRLRFPEFKGDWIILRGAEITSKITKGSSPNWQGFTYQAEGVLFVTSENVRDGFLDVSEPKFLPEEFFSKQSNSHLFYGDILINIVGASIGRSCIYRLRVPAFTNQAVALFRVTTDHSSEFLSYCYQHDRSQKAVSASQSDSARPNLSLSDLREMEFCITTLPEQQRIADCLSSLDDLIAAQTQTLEALKTHKQGLMQQLFPSPEAASV